jgi:hypothetical protein
MEKYKTLCTHCGQKYTYTFSGYKSEIKCKNCKKDMNTKFDFVNKTLTLY